jgi:hypothetical protein
MGLPSRYLSDPPDQVHPLLPVLVLPFPLVNGSHKFSFLLMVLNILLIISNSESLMEKAQEFSELLRGSFFR